MATTAATCTCKALISGVELELAPPPAPPGRDATLASRTKQIYHAILTSALSILYYY